MDIQNKYNDLFNKHGKSNLSLGWGSKERSNLRFKILTDEWDLSDQKILDFGCGFGDLSKYIFKNKAKIFSYNGVDLNDNFINIADKNNKNINSTFQVKNIFNDKFEIDCFDYSFVSGTFNDFRRNKYVFFENVLNELNRISKKGIAMNFLSSYAEKKYDHASYFSPEKIISRGYRISKNIVLRNDYMPYEFSVIITKSQEINEELTIYNKYFKFI